MPNGHTHTHHVVYTLWGAEEKYARPMTPTYVRARTRVRECLCKKNKQKKVVARAFFVRGDTKIKMRGQAPRFESATMLPSRLTIRFFTINYTT